MEINGEIVTRIPFKIVLRFAEWVLGVSFIRLKAVTLRYYSTLTMSYGDF